MSRDRQQRADGIFDELADSTPAQQRQRLDEIAAHDPELAAEVRALLDADARSHPILNHDTATLSRELLDAPEGAVIPGRIGRYVLEEFLGEGGMSWVYLARREDLGDRVALKFLHDLWSSPGDRRRFAREQATLAALNHRFIARLYDAGVADGKPWFAMEYVNGTSIVAHCEARALGLRERLRLFRNACEAVSYAHRKLTVHLDLKPSNVWVTGDGEVKLLDFGIAQHLAQDGRAVDATAIPRRLLSLNYAAPEQIAGEPLDVQADVYALGALLYRLLTGSVPVDRHDTSAAELAAALQQEVGRPSLRARANGRTGVAASRSEWRDLDALCGQALNRDKTLRYQTVADLAADVDRFLAHEPLAASRDRRHYYRARKFLWRHRRAAAAVASVALTISTLVVFFNVRLIAARDEALSSEARLRRIHRLMLGLFEGDDAAAGPAAGLRVADLLDRGVRDAESLRSDPELQAELHYTLGGLYHKLGHLDRAEPLLRAALRTEEQLHGAGAARTVRPRLALAILRLDQSEIADARALVEEAGRVVRIAHPEESFEVATVDAALGKVLVTDGDYKEGLPRLERAVRVLSNSPPSVELSEALGDLANGLYYEGRVSESEAVNRRALALDQQVFGERHPNVAVDLFNLGNIELDRANYAAGESLFRRALTLAEGWYGAGHPKVAGNVLMLGRALVYQGRLAEAAPLYDRAREMYRTVYGEQSVRYASVLSLMGDLARDRRQFADAQRLFEEAGAIFSAVAGADHEFALHQLSNLGSLALARGRYAEAEDFLRRALAGLTAAVPGQRYTAIAAARLAEALAARGELVEAASHAEAGYAILDRVAGQRSAQAEYVRRVLIDIYSGLDQPEKRKAVEEAARRAAGEQRPR